MWSHHSKDTEAALADARLAVAKASICSGPVMLAKVCDSSGFGCADVSWPMPRIFDVLKLPFDAHIELNKNRESQVLGCGWSKCALFNPQLWRLPVVHML